MSSIINSLADALPAGTACDFTSEADRSISSSDFADLVGGRGTVTLNEMHPRGLQAKGLHVTGDIDWSFDRWCAVRLDSCEFDNPIAAAGLRVDGDSRACLSVVSINLQTQRFVTCSSFGYMRLDGAQEIQFKTH